MRWERLFDDLEAQANAFARAGRSAEIADRARIEVGRLQLAERLCANLGAELRLCVAGGVSVAGRLQATGADWMLLVDTLGVECLVVTTHLHSVVGLGRWAGDPEATAGGAVRAGTGELLRALSTDRGVITMHLVDGSSMSGTIERVGADFVDVTLSAPGEPRGAPAARTAVVHRAAVAMIRRHG